jgi:cytoskeletal protein RodZ
MPYPNTVLAAWQIALLAVVALGTLAFWLVAVFVAAREPRTDRAAVASPSGTAAGVAAGSMQPAAAGEPEPAQAGSQMAA